MKKSLSQVSQKFLKIGWQDINDKYEYKITCMNKHCDLYSDGYRYYARLRIKHTPVIISLRVIKAQNIKEARQKILKIYCKH